MSCCSIIIELKSRAVIKPIIVDKHKLDDLRQNIESPNISIEAKYAIMKKVVGGVCSRCEEIPTKILTYDVGGAHLIEKYCDRCFKKWVKS